MLKPSAEKSCQHISFCPTDISPDHESYEHIIFKSRNGSDVVIVVQQTTGNVPLRVVDAAPCFFSDWNIF